MNDIYLDKFNQLANDYNPKKTYEEKRKEELDRCFFNFVQEFKKTIEKLVKNGSFMLYHGKHRIVGTIKATSWWHAYDEDHDDYQINIVVAMPKECTFSLNNSGRKVHYYQAVVGPFYKETWKCVNKQGYLNRILGKTENIVLYEEETEKTNDFVSKFNNELFGFAQITKQYPFKYEKSGYHGQNESWQQYYDFEVIF